MNDLVSKVFNGRASSFHEMSSIAVYVYLDEEFLFKSEVGDKENRKSENEREGSLEKDVERIIQM
jgi:hypothetical protein